MGHCVPFSNQVVAGWCDKVTFSDVIEACQMFDKPCRIVPGITGP